MLTGRLRPAAVAALGVLALSGEALALDCKSNATGNWSVVATWTDCGGGTPGAGDTVQIRNPHTVTQNVTATVAALTVDSGGILTVGGVTLTVSGATSVSGTLNITSTAGTKTFNGAVTINSGGTWNNSANEAVTFGADLTNNGTFTSGTATQTFTAATAQWLGSSAITFSGAVTANGSVVVTKSAGAVTVSGTFNVSGDLTVTAGTLNVANNVTVNGATSISGTLGITATTGTKNFNGAVTVNAGGTWSNTVNEAVTFRGGLTVNGTFTAGTAAHTFATNNQAIGGASAITIPSITVTAITLTNNGTLTASTALAGTGTFVNGPGATLNILGTSTVSGFNASAAGNTVNYGGAGQTVRNPVASTYHHLTLSGSGTKTMPAAALAINGNFSMSGTAAATSAQAMTVAGDFTVGAGATFTAGAFNHGVAGDFTATGTFNATANNSTFTFNGAALQTLTGPAAFRNMTVNNSGAGLQLASDITVTTAAAGVLTLTAGNIDTQANVLIVIRNCNVSATVPVDRSSPAAGWIVGNLRKTFPAGSPVTCSFEVGDAATFAPITSVSFTAVTAAGTLQARTDPGDHADTTAGLSGIDAANSANRTWTLTLPSGSTLAFAANTYSAVFNFIAGDLDGGATTASFVVAKKAGGDWMLPPVGARTATSTQATGITPADGFGEFAAGALGRLAEWRMDNASWSDSSGSGFHGTGAGLSGTFPTVSNASPAVPGSPGTCAYGVFNRATKTYIALPASFPNLGARSFTIAAWIRTSDNTQSGQRIFIDDENNTGGYGFSLGDGGTGTLRFFSRGTPSALILDTGNVIANGTWYFVAAVADVPAKRKTIYVYNTAGALLASPSATWTEASFGSDAGIASIGGETNASGEGTSAFGFAGNIDEVRIFPSALGPTHLDQVRQIVRPCVFVDHYAISHSGTGVTCQAENVTISAHDATHVPMAPLSTITVTAQRVAGVSGNRGDWLLVSGTGTLDNGAADDGVATYTFGAGETFVVLGLKNTHLQTVNINVLDTNGISESSGFGGTHPDPDLEFKESGFRFSTIGTQVAGTTSATYELQAIRTDTATGTCTAVFSGLVAGIELASECVNPTACQPGQQVTFNNNGAWTLAANSSGAVSSYTATTLSFGAASTAQFTFNYPDVGAIRLHARYNIPLAGGAPSGNYMTGATDSGGFVVRPATFRVTNIRRTADSFANPGASDATGPAFIQAGEDIALTLRAENTLGNLTPNFGKETPPEGVRLTANLVAPTPGNNPPVGGGTVGGAAFSGGQASVTDVTWGEVGIITLTPGVADGNYLGTGDVTGITTGNVGRFTPKDFAVSLNAPQFATGCPVGSFTYVGQSFGYAPGGEPVITVTARNKAGSTTQNYKGTAPPAAAFFKITNASLTGRAYSAVTGTLDTGGLPPTATDPAIVANGDGTGTLTFSSGAGIAFSRSTPVAPFSADISLAINVADADGVSYAGNPATFAGIAFTSGGEMRFGRLRLANALGSEKLPLPVALETQYWNGSAFVRNTADGCTTLLQPNFTLSDYSAPVPSLGITLAPCKTAVTPAGAIGFSAGRATLTLAAPGADNRGSVRLTPNLGTTASGNYCPSVGGPESAATAANRAYLQGAWTGTSYTENPSARATFGLYGGQPRNFIFFRENF